MNRRNQNHSRRSVDWTDPSFLIKETPKSTSNTRKTTNPNRFGLSPRQLGLSAALALLTLSALPVGAESIAITNHKIDPSELSATATSTQSGGFSAAGAVDGLGLDDVNNPTTHVDTWANKPDTWKSADHNSTSPQVEQWLVIDLGGSRDLTGLRVWSAFGDYSQVRGPTRRNLTRFDLYTATTPSPGNPLDNPGNWTLLLDDQAVPDPETNNITVGGDSEGNDFSSVLDAGAYDLAGTTATHLALFDMQNGGTDGWGGLHTAIAEIEVFELPPTTPPTIIAMSPVDDATGVAVWTNLVATFNRSIVFGTGSITIKESGGAVVEAFNVATPPANLTLSGATLTIKPTSDLAAATGYYVEISDTAIDDTVGNSFAGIAGTTTWSFTTGVPDTTAPTIGSLDSPATGVTGVSADAGLVLTFDEDMQKGTGNIVIRRASDGSVVETIDVTGTNVSITGGQVTIITEFLLPVMTGLYVEIDGGAFLDLSGNPFAGISGAGAWSFSTELKLAITPNLPDSDFQLSWESWTDKRYNLYRSVDLSDWPLEQGGILATPPVNTLDIDVDPAESRLFYRVEEAVRPNIIIVMADDMGFSDLGSYGGEINTPAIDKLATEGVRFSQFYNCNVCGPSRASLMTGCYPWQVGQGPGSGIFDNLTGNCATILELLKDNGYETCTVGRLDMVTADNWHSPTDLAGAASRFLGSVSGGPGNYYKQASGTPWYRDGVAYNRQTGDYSTDLISDFVSDYIEGTAGSDQPFCMYVSHYAPHWPLQADEVHIAPYRNLYETTSRAALMNARLQGLIASGLVPAGTTLHDSALNASDSIVLPASERLAIHAAMVESIDRSVADIMTALENAGKLENTLILVFSDNGSSHQIAFSSPVPEGVRPGSINTFINHGAEVASVNNTPFQGYKLSDYEGGIASPLIAWWPAGLKDQGRNSHVPCHIADLMPTCLELAGVPYPTQFRGRNLIPLVGQSLVPHLNNVDPAGAPPRVLAWPKALREGDWKLVLGNAGGPELYDLSQDRNEKQNRAAEFPAQVLQMQNLHGTIYAP